MEYAGYNSRQRMTFFTRLLVLLVALLLLPPAHAALRWDSPSAELARQIATITGPGTVTLDVRNRTSISSEDVAAIRHALERELRSAGVMVRQRNADSDVRVTLSQNTQGWLWVAEIQEGSQTQVTMLQLAGGSASETPTSGPAITLHAKLLQSQSDPILDVMIVSSGSEQHMIVLEPERVRVYSAADAGWQLAQSYDIPHAQAFPRDVRGRIVPAGDHLFDAYLPGVTCAGTKAGESWNMTVLCQAAENLWPLGSQKAAYASTRNFFTGDVQPGFGPKPLRPFYSAAELARTAGSAFLEADTSGQVLMLEGNSRQGLVGTRDWGSDITGVRSECGAGAQVLASAAGWPLADSMRAYETSGHQATPVSAPLAFDGVVTAVWPTSDPTSATVVVENQQQLRYEAYSVSVSCPR